MLGPKLKVRFGRKQVDNYEVNKSSTTDLLKLVEQIEVLGMSTNQDESQLEKGNPTEENEEPKELQMMDRLNALSEISHIEINDDVTPASNDFDCISNPLDSIRHSNPFFANKRNIIPGSRQLRHQYSSNM
jgi:hypothetical protein